VKKHNGSLKKVKVWSMMEDYGIERILELLPHRYPFVLVDRVMKVLPGEKLVALKNVSINEPFFQGHFPDRKSVV